MVQRIATDCDQHAARGEQVPGVTWRLAVMVPGGRFTTYDIDACADCAKPFVELAQYLGEVGRPVDGKAPGKPRGPQAQPDLDTPEADRTCPVCQYVSTTRTAMRQHLRAKHDQTLAQANNAPPESADLVCPECQDTFSSPQGLGAHRSRRHGVKGAQNRTPPAGA